MTTDAPSRWLGAFDGGAPASVVAQACPALADTARDARSVVLGGGTGAAASLAVDEGKGAGTVFDVLLPEGLHAH